MPERLRLVLPHTVMLLVSIFLYWSATQIDGGGAASGGRVGPDFWPKIIIGFMGLLCVYEIVKRLVVHSTFTAKGLTQSIIKPPAEAVDPTMGSDDTETPQPEHPRMLWAGSAAILGYVVVVPFLGFFLTTLLFLATFIRIGGFRRPLVTVLVSALGAFVLVVIFMRVAYISLPLGIGPFQSLSTALLALIGVK